MGAAAAAATTVTVAVVAGAGHLSAAPSARATRVEVVRSNWYWLHVADALGIGVAPVPEPSNVGTGDLAVAADQQGNPTKESYVALDTSAVPDGTTVTGAHLVVAVDQSQTQLAATQNAATAPALEVCLPGSTWAAGSGAPWANKPADDCSHAVPGTYDAAAQTYTFTLPSAVFTATDLSTVGVAIRGVPPATPAATPFQVDLSAPATMVVTLDVTPAPAPPPSEEPVVTTAPATAPVAILPAPVAPVVRPLPTATAAPAPAASSAPAPAVAPATPTVVVIRHPVIPGRSMPPALFLALALLAAVALAGLAATLHGDTPEPADLLRRRRLARTAAAMWAATPARAPEPAALAAQLAV